MADRTVFSWTPAYLTERNSVAQMGFFEAIATRNPSSRAHRHNADTRNGGQFSRLQAHLEGNGAMQLSERERLLTYAPGDPLLMGGHNTDFPIPTLRGMTREGAHLVYGDRQHLSYYPVKNAHAK